MRSKEVQSKDPKFMPKMDKSLQQNHGFYSHNIWDDTSYIFNVILV